MFPEPNTLIDAFFCLCEAAHQNSKDKGFWGPVITVDESGNTIPERAPNYGEKYMLMVSELCELFEAHRKGKLTAPCDKPCHVIDPTSTEPTRVRCIACNGTGKEQKLVSDDDGNVADTYFANCQTCAGQGLITTTGTRPLTNEEEELADLLIRVADYCGYRNINLGAVIIAKMQYNTTRPHMHNKLC